MFDDLRAAFKEALDNFNKELNRDQVSDAADKLLVGMRKEIVDEKAQVSGLEDQVAKTRAQIERLTQEAATTRRRESLAREIDDEETANLAAEYAAKVEGHRDVLGKKLTALEEELAFRSRTVKEMYARFEEAKEKREALKATTGRSGARETITAASDLFEELDRMADKIEGNEARGEAAREFDELELGGSEHRIDLDEEPRQELDVDAALAELKRRMGEQDEG
jgi:phage shock protein A